MINYHDSELIAQHDAHLLKEKCVKEYVNANAYQYYTGMNSWILLVKPYSEIKAKVLETEIRQNGLVPTIGKAQIAAMALITNDELPHPFAFLCSELTVADALEILRYLKRFSVVSDAYATTARSSFLQQNNFVGSLNRRCERNEFIIRQIADEAKELLKGYESPDFSELRLSNGVSYDGTFGDFIARCTEGKVASLEGMLTFYGDPLYPIVDADPRRYVESVRLGHLEKAYTSGGHARFSTVPKSYKTYRNIAVETVYKQSLQQGVRTALTKVLKINAGDAAPLENQAINGLHCLNDGIATADLSAASDSVSFWLIGQILPYNVLSDIYRARSYWVDIDSKPYLLNIVATMGSGFCFVLETIVFLSIARAATRCAALFLGQDSGVAVSKVKVYGDDIEVPDWAFDTVCDWLDHCGFTVNADKSFSEGAFYESCGFDWYDGDFVSSCYWPRNVVNSRPQKSVPILVALQNRIFERGKGLFYYDCQEFLANQVKRLDPDVAFVDLDTFIEYNLDGTCLLSFTQSDVVTKEYRRPYGLAPGDDKSYSEIRRYLPLIRTKYATIDMACYDRMEMYLYSKYLHDGPKYDDALSELLGITTPYHCRTLNQISDGYTVASVRLI